MPLRESKSIKVTMIVEVDGHTLRFEESGKATGARYHGEEPPASFRNSVLEANIRAAFAECVARATLSVGTFLIRAYPVHGDARTKVSREARPAVHS